MDAIVRKAIERRTLGVAPAVNLLWTSGIRMNHIADLRLKDLNWTSAGWKIDIRNLKNGADRADCLRVNVSNEVVRWIQRRASTPNQPAFPGWNATHAREIIDAVSQEEGWPEGYTYDLHAFRRAFAVRRTQEGASIETIMKEAGWNDKRTAEWYIRPTEPILLMAVQRSDLGRGERIIGKPAPSYPYSRVPKVKSPVSCMQVGGSSYREMNSWNLSSGTELGFRDEIGRYGRRKESLSSGVQQLYPIWETWTNK